MDSDKDDRINRYRRERRTYSFSDRDNIEKNDLDYFVKTLYNYNNSRLLYFIKEEPGRVASIIYAMVKYPELINIFANNFN